MEQVDKRPGDFRYELGDGAYITGIGGTVTIVAENDVVVKCNNFKVEAKGEIKMTAGGEVNITAGGIMNLKAAHINLN